MPEYPDSASGKRGAGRSKEQDRKADAQDPRIGQTVADDRWTQISYADGSTYRVEDGQIVEKLG